jgi:hypothetical protein
MEQQARSGLSPSPKPKLSLGFPEYRRLSPYATGDALAVSGEVNRMIAAAINVNPRWFWDRPDA